MTHSQLVDMLVKRGMNKKEIENKNRYVLIDILIENGDKPKVEVKEVKPIQKPKAALRMKRSSTSQLMDMVKKQKLEIEMLKNEVRRLQNQNRAKPNKTLHNSNKVKPIPALRMKKQNQNIKPVILKPSLQKYKLEEKFGGSIEEQPIDKLDTEKTLTKLCIEKYRNQEIYGGQIERKPIVTPRTKIEKLATVLEGYTTSY